MVKLIAASAAAIALAATGIYAGATTLEARDDARNRANHLADVLDSRVFNSKRDRKYVEAAFAHGRKQELEQIVLWKFASGGFMDDATIMAMTGSLYGETIADMKKQGAKKYLQHCYLVSSNEGDWDAGYCTYDPVAEG